MTYNVFSRTLKLTYLLTSGTGSPGWSWKRGCKTVVVWCGSALVSDGQIVAVGSVMLLLSMFS